MEIIPAIDIKNGKCVRLYQGNYTQETIYSTEPLLVARQWESLGAQRIHLVDLDGASLGKPQNIDTIKSILMEVRAQLQLGGGIRDRQTVRNILDMGVGRVILGTAAIEEPDLIRELCSSYGERIVIGIDARDGIAASHGWGKISNISAIELAHRMTDIGVRRLIYTDISRDGTLTSPNFQAISELLTQVKVPVIASGGVSEISHLENLAHMGVEGAIIGKAIYTGDIDFKRALETLKRRKIMPHKFEISKIDRLDSPERLKRLPSFEGVFSLLPLKPTQSVADLGCGTGTFSLNLAKYLSEGKLYCLDISEEMLERVRKKVIDNKVSNIIVKKCSEIDLGLEPQSLDGVFMAFVLHEQDNRITFLKTIRDTLKKGGWVGFVEWIKMEMPEGPPLFERIDQTEARDFASKAGLKVLKEKILGDKHYLMVLEK